MDPAAAPRYRFERFGGILASEEPPLMAHVDQDFMRGLGLGPSPLWDLPPREALSAPAETHMTITRRCPMACSHCYTDSSPSAGQDLPTAEVFARLESLAAMGVFHIALGGGEAFLRDDLLSIAREARRLGITPNLTTNGLAITAELAAECAALFGQVNLSVDGIGERSPFGEDKTTPGLQAAALLVAAGARVGFNIVVSRQTFPELEAIIARAAELQLSDVELLRYKPAGRGRDDYLARRLTPAQRLALFPKVLEWTERYRIAIKMDCSSAPFITCHEPDAERMKRFDVLGCIGGLSLLGADERGRIAACSFYPHEEADLLDLAEAWESPGRFAEFRRYPERAAEPCRSCPYLESCRGGCRAVALFLTGDPWAPDPECPRVQAHAEMEV